MHSNTPLYLAIDQGGHASRASLYTVNGAFIGGASVPIHTRRPAPEHVEHDPEELVASIRAAIKQVAEYAGSSPIAGAGFATQRSSVVCWDKDNGAALSPVLSWQDRRTSEWIRKFAVHSADIRQRTGLPLSPHYGASKLRWCWDHVPAVKKAWKAGRLAWGPLASYLTFRLTKEKTLAVDPANASRTLLWNLDLGDWDPHLAELFGIPVSALPTCVATRYAWGLLDCEALSIPLTLVTGDQSAALFAVGELTNSTVMINLGTGAFLQQALERRPAPSRLLTSVAYQDLNRQIYALEGTVNGAGSALSWAASHLGLEESDIIRHLPQWLKEYTQPPLFLNGIAGLGTPYLHPLFTSRYIGSGSPAEKCVAVCESIIFLLQRNLEEMAAMGNSAIRIIISGGLSKIDGLCQRLADLSGLPLFRLDDHEATIQGLIWLLTNNPRSMEKEASEASFLPREAPSLESRYRAWREELEAAL